MIGSPGKCPAKNGSSPVIVLTAKSRAPFSYSVTASMKRNGSRCGTSAVIAARSRTGATSVGTAVEVRHHHVHDRSHGAEPVHVALGQRDAEPLLEMHQHADGLERVHREVFDEIVFVAEVLDLVLGLEDVENDRLHTLLNLCARHGGSSFLPGRGTGRPGMPNAECRMANGECRMANARSSSVMSECSVLPGVALTPP